MTGPSAVDPVASLLVGCGRAPRPGWTNLDLAGLPGVDVVHDLDSGPLPFPDGSFARIDCPNVLEHVADLTAVMAELHRVAAPGASLRITAPHFTSADWPADPTHRRAFSINTFEFFTEASWLGRDYYFDFSFERVESRRLRFHKKFQPWNYLVEALVNLHPKVQTYYEATGLSRLFPAQVVEVVLVR